MAGQSNGNGVVATPEGESLIIGYWYSGALYRRTFATGEVRKITAPPLPSADGIALRGNTLHIARSADNEIATVRLSGDSTLATVVAERTYPGADTTTGVAVSRGPAARDHLPDGHLPLRHPADQPGVHRHQPAPALTAESRRGAAGFSAGRGVVGWAQLLGGCRER